MDDFRLRMRYALLEVVVVGPPIKPTLEEAVSYVEGLTIEDEDGVSNPLYTSILPLTVRPSVGRVWSNAADWGTVSQKVNLDLETAIIFDIGADADVVLSPSDGGGPKNAPGLDPLVITVVEDVAKTLDPTSATFVDDRTVRSRTAYSVAIPHDDGATPPVPTAEGSKFYLSFKTTADDKYWTVELSYMRPYIFTDATAWLLQIALGRYRNHAHFEYAETAERLASRLDLKYTYVVSEVALKPGGVFAVSFRDAAAISVFGSDDFPRSVNTAAPFSELSTTQTEIVPDLGAVPDFPYVVDAVGYAWQLPSDAPLGTVYTVGLTATVGEGDDAVDYSGIWEITAVDTPMLCETAEQFSSTVPDGAFAFKFSEDALENVGDAEEPGMWKVTTIERSTEEAAHKLNLRVGSGFSVEIVVDGVTAEAADPRTIADEFGVLLNQATYVLELRSAVATKTTDKDSITKVKTVTWAALATGATAALHPSFAWVVPQ